MGQLLMMFVPPLVLGPDNALVNSAWWIWLVNCAPLYLLGIPAALWLLRRIPGEAPEENRLGAKELLTLIPMIYCVVYVGNLIGTFLSGILSGGTATNALESFVMEDGFVKVLFMVILAPLLEEFIFRKQIIDRTRRYGEKTAVLLSGLTFGLFHMNLYQFFYALGVGLVLGYVYIRTGRLRYCVLLHGFVNFLGSVVAPAVLSLLDMDLLSAIDAGEMTEEMLAQYSQALPGLMAYMAYFLFILALTVTGLVLLIVKRKKFIWKEAPEQLPKGTAAKTVYRNVGMLLFILLCAAFMVLALL